MPDYSTNDPKGWCGDSRRGAAMGRPTIQDAPQDFSGKLALRRVRLNGDYDSNGTYFGGGYGTLPLYWVASEDGEIDYMLRARDRVDAKAKVVVKYPQARFYR
jgi:hypothetical protein